MPSYTAEQYEKAIAETKIIFKKNKSRMWVLKILEEKLVNMSELAREEKPLSGSNLTTYS